MAENFFPPELIMHNQQALGLTAEQQNRIRSEMQKMMTQLTDLQWQMSGAAEKMIGLVKADRPDEKAVLAQLDKLLEIENKVKRNQVGLMVTIKNILTPEQQTKLRRLRRPGRPRPADRGSMRGPGGGPVGPPPAG